MSPRKLLLKGGTVVSGQGAARLDLLVDGETIAQLSIVVGSKSASPLSWR